MSGSRSAFEERAAAFVLGERGAGAVEDIECPVSADTHSVLNGTALRLVLSHPIQMRMSDMTAKQLFSVSCPTCGVAPGERCLLHSGAPRTEPHLDRKLSAAEAIVTKRIPRGPGRR